MSQYSELRPIYL